MASSGFYLFKYIFALEIVFQIVSAQIADNVVVLQNQYGVCSSVWNPEQRNLQIHNEYTVISHTIEQTYYWADRDCVISLIGKIGYQWSIRITKFDVEGEMGPGGIPVKCNDFVKLFDAERCDNAKLLKGIDYKTGICGSYSESQMSSMLFTTCANKLTIQFKTDIRQNFNTGFAMSLRQYEWQNPTGAPDCDPDLNGIAPGVWRDGTFNEFQNTWNEQPIIPGYVAPGTETDYDKEQGGITCYDCIGCPVDPFDPERDGTAKKQNCYTCSKEWDEQYQNARRKCYSRNDLNSFIQQYEAIDGPFTGCRKLVNVYGSTVNYCFCDENLCNTGTTSRFSYSAMILSVVATLFIYLQQSLI